MSAVVHSLLPYCGAPPDPSVIWQRWRLDPAVLAVLSLGLAAFTAGAVRRSAPASRVACFVAGWIVATLALVSPLCPLSVSLFAARATQHVVLTMIAAPLVVFGLAGAFDNIWPQAARISLMRSPLAATFAFAGVVWFWHAPSPYLLTFESVTAYWTMHVTMFACACWLWHCLLQDTAGPVENLLASLISTVQMGFLGALITLSPRPLYSPHFLTTDAWGLTPLQDQAIGGIVMWVLGCVAFLIVALASLRSLLARKPARVPVLARGLEYPA
jgi:putative membrane protein